MGIEEPEFANRDNIEKPRSDKEQLEGTWNKGTPRPSAQSDLTHLRVVTFLPSRKKSVRQRRECRPCC